MVLTETLLVTSNGITKVLDLSAAGLSTFSCARDTWEDEFDSSTSQAIAHMSECLGSTLLLIGAFHDWPHIEIEYMAMACLTLAPILYMLATWNCKVMKIQDKRESYVDNIVVLVGIMFLNLTYVLERYDRIPIEALFSEVFGYLILIVGSLYYTIYPPSKRLPRFGRRDSWSATTDTWSSICFLIRAFMHHFKVKQYIRDSSTIYEEL